MTILVASAIQRVDAIVVYDPYLSAAESMGARSLGKPFDAIALNFLDAAYFTTLPYATAHRDAILKFAAIVNRGDQYFNTHFDDLIPLIISAALFDESVYSCYSPPSASSAPRPPTSGATRRSRSRRKRWWRR